MYEVGVVARCEEPKCHVRDWLTDRFNARLTRRSATRGAANLGVSRTLTIIRDLALKMLGDSVIGSQRSRQASSL